MEINSANLAVQELLIPIEVKSNFSDINNLILFKSKFKTLGIEFHIKDNSIFVTSVPAIIKNLDFKTLISDILYDYNTWADSDIIDTMIYKFCSYIACHGSVRKGRVLNVDEMNALLRKIENTPMAGHCSHGRPTWFELSLLDIEKLFER